MKATLVVELVSDSMIIDSPKGLSYVALTHRDKRSKVTKRSASRFAQGANGRPSIQCLCVIVAEEK